MDWATVGVAVLTAIVSFAGAWGAGLQARKDLERRHAALATEVRAELPKMQSLITKVAVLEEQSKGREALATAAVNTLDKSISRLDAKLDSLIALIIGEKGNPK